MNYWLGRASYYEKEGIDISSDVTLAYRSTASLVHDDPQPVDLSWNVPKRNIAQVYVTFDKENV